MNWIDTILSLSAYLLLLWIVIYRRRKIRAMKTGTIPAGKHKEVPMLALIGLCLFFIATGVLWAYLKYSETVEF